MYHLFEYIVTRCILLQKSIFFMFIIHSICKLQGTPFGSIPWRGPGGSWDRWPEVLLCSMIVMVISATWSCQLEQIRLGIRNKSRLVIVGLAIFRCGCFGLCSMIAVIPGSTRDSSIGARKHRNLVRVHPDVLLLCASIAGHIFLPESALWSTALDLASDGQDVKHDHSFCFSDQDPSWWIRN